MEGISKDPMEIKTPEKDNSKEPTHHRATISTRSPVINSHRISSSNDSSERSLVIN